MPGFLSARHPTDSLLVEGTGLAHTPNKAHGPYARGG